MPQSTIPVQLLSIPQVEVQRDCDPRLERLSISGDPYLLELAIGAILETQLEQQINTAKSNSKYRCTLPALCPLRLGLLVSDNGIGIAASNLAKVMLPFFSTKTDHVGLGLCMASRFIEMHGGNLKIKSSMEKGTDVLVFLPLKGNVQDACR